MRDKLYVIFAKLRDKVSFATLLRLIRNGLQSTVDKQQRSPLQENGK